MHDDVPRHLDAQQQVFSGDTLVNAMDALEGCAPNQRSIKVSAHQVNPATVEVRVCDSGPGMPAESLARVFAPFFTTKAHGTGLGLAISRNIIQDHGGTIQAECPANGGTTFIIELPLASSDG